MESVSQIYTCNICNKKYRYSSGLSRHMKKCHSEDNTPCYYSTENFSEAEKSLLEKQQKQIEDLQKLLQNTLEQNKNTMDSLIPKLGNNTFNTTNNKMTINVFLNEQCKDAVNLIDFIKDNYQKIKTVELSDNAITYCYSEIIKERISIQLYYLYLLKYGKGYYMQNFGFTISYNDDIILHNDNIKNYLKFVLKYEDFKKYLTSGANKKYEKLIDELRRFFTINGELKQELHFKDISRNLKQNKYDCYFLRQLIIYIIRNADLYNLTYNTYHLSI